MGDSRSAGNTSPTLLENPKPQAVGRIRRNKGSLSVVILVNQMICTKGIVYRDYWSFGALPRIHRIA